MTEPIKQSTMAGVEQRYARVLELGIAVALPLMLVCFGLYVSGLFHPAVPVATLPQYWHLSASEYLEILSTEHLQRTSHLTGWSWVTELHHGEYLTCIGIALLPLLTMVCYLAIIPPLLRARERLYGSIAMLEMVILTLAASGLLKAAGH